MRKVAPRFGLLDQPDARRKLHGKPIPVSGGIAIFIAAVLVLSGIFWISDDWYHLFRQRYPALCALGAGSLLLVIVGAVDDRFSINGFTKLIYQVVASSIVVLGGMSFESISLLGYDFPLGPLAFPVAVFWLLGTINAMNLLDGLDGMAGTVGVMIIITIGIGSQVSQRPMVALLAFVLCGCLLGFLYHNLPPARIFLGDSGSMLIGLVGGALAIMGSHKSTGAVLFSVPVALLTIPIIDSLAAVLRRKMTGRSIFDTDRNHFHHRLMKKLGCNRKVLYFVSGICIGTSILALTSQLLQNDWISVIGVLGVVAFLVVTDTFGLQEIKLIIRSLPSSLTWRMRKEAGKDHEKIFSLQGHRPWKYIWNELLLSTINLGCQEVRLDISMPKDHEEFIAVWKRHPQIHKDSCHEFKIALKHDSQCIGYLKVTILPEHFHSTRQMLLAVSEIDLLCEDRIASILKENPWRSLPGKAA